jgi:hypothetical protein
MGLAESELPCLPQDHRDRLGQKYKYNSLTRNTVSKECSVCEKNLHADIYSP